MFGWRKKPDGFEWHQYIRTTIKVRRENRRQRLEDAKRVAGEQVGAAGAALAAGSKAAGAAAREGARAGLGIAGHAAQSAGGALLAGAGALLHRLAVAARPLTIILERPKVGASLALAGAIALGSGIGRLRSIGLDGETLVALGLGLALGAAALPWLSRLTGTGMPKLGFAGIPPRAMVAGIAVLAVAGIAWFVSRGGVDLRLPMLTGAKPIEGRAQAVGGDLLRIGNATVRLAGIEAPEAEQRCGKGNRQWRCGAAAQAALSRLVSGRTVRCAQESSDDAGRIIAQCTAGDTDIAGELVERGHVFAESGFFARYSSHEQEAKTAKQGIWSGEADRPSDHRAKVWEEAKRRAPDGCPIKGLLRDGDRIYVLPGAPDYERGRVQASRGERWFCSERDAQSAGFKASTRG